MTMTKSVILVLMAVVALLAASSVSGDRSIDLQNIMNLEGNEAGPVTLSIGNRKIVHLLTLPWDHCVPQGNPCGLLDWCCGSLRCTGIIPGQQYVYGSCA